MTAFSPAQGTGTPDVADTARCHALIPAAGVGTRMGDGVPPKQYLPLAGRPMIWHAIAALAACPSIARVFVVLAPEDAYWHDADYAAFGERLAVLRAGGPTRAQSVAQGLAAMRRPPWQVDDTDWILVHDAARPCLTPAAVARLIAQVRPTRAGGILAVPVADTLKRAQDGAPASIAATVAREGLWQAQTPPMFRAARVASALDAAPVGTDEASAVEASGLHPLLVEGEPTNLKVTWPRDLALAELILRQQQEQSA